MATRADIEIAVKGIQRLKEARAEINKLNKEINRNNKKFTKEAEEKGILKKGNKTSVGAASQVRSINTLNKQLSQARRNFNRVALGTEDAAEAAIQLKKAQDALNKAYADQNKLMGTNNQLSGSALQKQTDIARGKFAGSGPGVFGPQPRQTFRQRIGATRGFDKQSALISGAFPLLFGQGPVASLAGGLGGGVGGMFGQMGGFAGGIAATAAVQSISNFTKAIGELGNALSRPTENIGSLVEKLGLANDPAGRLALRLEKLGLTSSASALLMEEFTKQTGKSPDVLKNAAEEINEMNKSLATFGLKLQLLGAEVITPIVDALNKIPFGAIGNKIKPITNLLMFGQFEDPSETVNRMKGISNIPASEGNAIIGGVPLNPDFGKTAPQIDKTSALEALAGQTEFNRNILPLQQSLDIEKQRFNLSSKDLAVKREANKLDLKNKELSLLKQQAAIKTNDALNLKIQKLTAEVALQQQIFENAQTLADPIKAQTIQLDQQMRVLLDRGSQVVALSQAISSSFEQSFKGIINGTISVQDGFRNMLNSIANHFLNTAAKMMANQMQRSLLGFLGNNLFGGSLGGGGFSNFVGNSSLTGAFSPNAGGLSPLLGFANGGRPQVGRPSIVGERGPELFVPRSSGTIVPNNKLGGGGSTSVVVNVDASGSDVQGDDAGAKELGTLISVAVQGELVRQQRPGGLLSSIR